MRCNFLSGVGAFAVAAAMATSASATTLFSDDFETDTSASYTVVDDSSASSGDGTADGEATFAFDYVAAGLPLAPNSAVGDTGGLRFTANESAGELDHYTAYNNTEITSSAFTIQVDMYMGVDGTASGTTEFASVGLATDRGDFNSIFSPIAGSGHFVSITGEGGSSSDYRHFTPSVTSVASGDPSYLNTDNTTNATGDTYLAIFPDSEYAGSPGNQWTTLTIDVNPSTVTYSLDGTAIIQTATEAFGGYAALGYADLFTSVGPHFVVYDNLIVSQVPEPGSMVLAALSCLGALAVVRRRK